MEKKGKQRVTITDGGGDKITLDHYDNGVLLAPDVFDDFDFDVLKTLKLRDDDVMFVSYPRTGCNWLWKMIRMIRMNTTELDDVMKQAGMLEMNIASTTEKLDLLPSPRTFNSHLRYCHLPKDVTKNKTKFVLIYRNPKDVAVSFYRLYCDCSLWEYNGKFDNFLQLFYDRTVDDNGYAEYLNDWAEVMKKNRDLPIHVLTYERLKENPIEELSKICRFLGVERDVSFLQAILDECKIDKMRDKAARIWNQLGVKDGHTTIHRKGIVGDWKNHFTVALSEQFDQYWSKAFTASKTFPMPGMD